MTEFKKGDRITCVEGLTNQLTAGKEYTVEHVAHWVFVTNDRGEDGAYAASRFSPVVAQPEVYVQRFPNGGFSIRTYPTKQAAIDAVALFNDDGYECEIWKITPVAHCKVRKIVEIDE